MKKFIFLAVLLLPIFVFGADNVVSDAMTDFTKISKTFWPTFQQAAQGLLWKLALIETVIVMGFMALRGEFELGGVMAALIKLMLIFGFFQFLLLSDVLFLSVFRGFEALAAKANGGSIGSLDTAIDAFFAAFDKWAELNTSLTDPSTYVTKIVLFFALAGLAFSFALLAGQLLQTYAFAQMAIYVGIFWVGFGGLSQTRLWAINALSNVVRWGMKYMMTLVIMGIALQLINMMMAKDMSQLINIIQAVFVAVMVITVNAGTSGFVDSYFSGMGGGENNRGMQVLQNASSQAASAAGAMIGGAAGAASGMIGGGMSGYAAAKDAATATGEPSPSAKSVAKSTLGGLASGGLKGAKEGSQKGLYGTLKQPPGLSPSSSFGVGNKTASSSSNSQTQTDSASNVASEFASLRSKNNNSNSGNSGEIS